MMLAMTIQTRFKHKSRLSGFTYSAILMAALAGTSAWGCDETEMTELESVYCSLKSKGKASGLPSYFQFKNNPPSVQWLLLKRPAARAGIPLPPKPAKATNTKETQTKTAESHNAPVNTSTKKNTSTPPNPASVTSGLDNCALSEHTITCEHSRFRLQHNLSNHLLSSSALSDSNRLKLQSFHPSIHLSVSKYLSNLYPIYVKKMLSIGLAEAVMSYTKFVTQYETVSSAGGNFTARMEQMFEILKQEKKSRKVKRSYQNTAPKSLRQCMFVMVDIIVCDDISHTWVFTLPRQR